MITDWRSLPKEDDSRTAEYKKDLRRRFLTYQRDFFPEFEEYFDRWNPPVFHSRKEDHNVLVRPGSTREETTRLLELLPRNERHKWFRSMKSSQALAQSVLGNLAVHNELHCLTEVTGDDSDEPLFGEAELSSHNFVMERKVTYLGEPRPTSLDGFISGKYQVAIECKFTEPEVGSCSRPRLKPSESNYEAEFCNGTFTKQRGREKRCALSEIGVLYWKYVPELFKWKTATDLNPCPLYRNYQLVRNVLAACVRSDGIVSPANGHVVLVYDGRNPAFQKGGKGFVAFEETREALRIPSLLRKCGWQRIIKHLRSNMILPWLTDQLELKYGF